MRICPTFVGFGAGVWAFTPEALERFRQGGGRDESGEPLAEALFGLGVNGCSFQRDAYRRPVDDAAARPGGSPLRFNAPQK